MSGYWGKASGFMFLLINKPKDWTSFDVVGYIRGHIRKSVNQDYPGIRKLKVGHAGTLDPFATGLLIVGIGREATKRLDEFKNLPKTYIATIKLGEVSDTFDSTGVIKKYKKPLLYCYIVLLLKKLFKKNSNKTIKQYNNNKLNKITVKKIQKVISKFLGPQHQLPPMFSAKKIKGKKLYELARKGITIKRKKNKIEIYKLELLSYDPKSSVLSLKAEVSSGTYIRTLANDIGERLGCGAYCLELTRTRIGNYSIDGAIEIEDIKNFEF